MAVGATTILLGTALIGAIGGSVGTQMAYDEILPEQKPVVQQAAPATTPMLDAESSPNYEEIPHYRRFYYDRSGSIHYIY